MSTPSATPSVESNTISEYTDTGVVIYLNRTSNSDSDNVFDLIQVSPIKNSYDFNFVYKSDIKTASETTKHRVIYAGKKSQMRQHILEILELIIHDAHPFHSVDVIIPGYPSVTFTIEKIRCIIPLINRCLDNYF